MRKHVLQIGMLLCVLVSVMSMTSSIQAQPAGCPGDMVHYWNLDENNPPYADFYGANSATCTNCPAATSGIVNGAQKFTLTNQVNVADTDTFDWGATDSFSVEFWMKTDSTSTSGTQVIVGRYDGSTSTQWWVSRYSGGTTGFYIRDRDGNDGWILGSRNLADLKWHHIVAVRDASMNELRIYVDGQIDGVATNVSFSQDLNSTVALNIGWMNQSTGFHFSGSLDEVALYKRALSESEILSHYYLVRNYCAMCDAVVRIMPLGDSIAAGWDVNTQTQIGFRRKLNLDLGYNIDFVGLLQDPDPLTNPDFDIDHQGHGGYHADQVAAHIYNWLLSNPADVILLHIGTNDISWDDENPQEVADILDEIDRFSEDIPVVLSRIISRTDTKALQTTQFNNDVVAMAQQRSNDKIIIVDHENALIYPDDMSSTVHPNATGYDKMANVWFSALSKFLPVCGQTAPLITSSPVISAIVGKTHTYDVSALGNPDPTYSLLTAPLWLNVHPATGLIAGIPDMPGSFDVIVQANNPLGTDTQEYTFDVVTCPLDMVHYWKLDELGGPQYLDFYGLNHAMCTPPNCPLAATGIVNGAQQFTGDDRLNIWDADSLDWGKNDSFSIEFWMKTNSTSTSGTQVIIGRYDGSTSTQWWVSRYSGGTTGFYIRDLSGNDGWILGSKNLADLQWHHVVAVRDASVNELRIYVDGQIDGVATNVSFSQDIKLKVDLNIGWMNQSTGFYFNGSLDEVALYKKALPLTEIQQHYANGMSGDGFCTASFTVSASAPGGHGTISCVPSTVNTGGSSTCTITPDANYNLSALTDNGTDVVGLVLNNTYTINNVIADHSVVATFTIDTFTVTASAPGGHGTISCTSPVNYGGSSTCTITPDANYNLSALTDNGTDVVGLVLNNTYTINNVIADHTVAATFSENTFTLAVEKTGTGNGTVTSSPGGVDCSADCSELYPYNTTVALTATPSADSIFVGWDGGGCSGSGICVVTMTNNISVTAEFKQYLAVLNPEAGTTWAAGTTQTISWIFAGNVGTSVRLELLRGGTTVASIIRPIGTGGSGSFTWTVSTGLTPASNYAIRITSTTVPTATDTSALFTITAPPSPTITVTNPEAGTTWAAGTTQTISWIFAGNVGTSVRLELLRGSTTVASIIRPIGTGGSGSFTLIVSTGLTPASNYAIRITSTTVPTATDTSALFTITAPPSPTITVTNPKAGTTWTAGTSLSQSIQWSYTGSIGYWVKVELLKSGDLNQTITYYTYSGSGGNGAYNWWIPSTLSSGNDYQIRVTSTTNGSYTNTSDNFTIVVP